MSPCMSMFPEKSVTLIALSYQSRSIILATLLLRVKVRVISRPAQRPGLINLHRVVVCKFWGRLSQESHTNYFIHSLNDKDIIVSA